MQRVSVCMATYNGRRFVEEQVKSIVEQLSDMDELVIVDDSSSDDTMALLEGLGDPRIKLWSNPRNLGVNATFEKAMTLAQGEYIFLSDQDDIWLPGRLDRMLAALQRPGVEFVVTNYALIDENGSAIGDGLAERLTVEDDDHRVSNLLAVFIGRKNYYGCAMAMTARFRDAALPLPRNVECHDLWLAICANFGGTIAHLEEDSLAHRVHGKNASIISRRLHIKLLSRLGVLKQFCIAWRRRVRFKQSIET